LFGESSFGTVAEFLPESGGYAPFLQGHVVDMIYCPILRGTFPDWLPIFGGDSFTFFRPIFNIADSAITVGVIYLLLFQRKFFKEI
ncbi:MAG TPA: signal peptidase II, partial [Bacteroidales bacterium]|nr:signal peptidase II [Bacteroidales bacterium]